MIKKMVSIFSFLIMLLGCDTERQFSSLSDFYFIKYYGGDGNQQGVDGLVMPDQTILILGASDIGGIKRSYLVKTDIQGQVMWKKTFGGPKNEIPVDIEPLLDGNYAILSSYDSAMDNQDLKVVKISPNGDVLDSVLLGTPVNDFPHTLTPLLDGGLIITGSTEFHDFPKGDPNTGNLRDAFHFRILSDLSPYTLPWENYFHQSNWDVAHKTVQLSANEFYVFGATQKSSTTINTDLNFWFYPIDNNGLPGNNSFFGNPTTDENLKGIATVPSGFSLPGFFMFGNSEDLNSNSLFIGQLKYGSSNSNVLVVDPSLFNNKISVPGFFLDPIAISPSLRNHDGYLLLANEIEQNGSKSNIWLSKIDQRGSQVIWSSRFGSLGTLNDDRAAAVMELSDGRILVVGTVYLQNQDKIVLMKLNDKGQFLK